MAVEWLDSLGESLEVVSADILELEEVESEMESNTRRKICLIQLVTDRTAQVLPI